MEGCRSEVGGVQVWMCTGVRCGVWRCVGVEGWRYAGKCVGGRCAGVEAVKCAKRSDLKTAHYYIGLKKNSQKASYNFSLREGYCISGN